MPDLLRTRLEPEQEAKEAALVSVADDLGIPTDGEAMEVCGANWVPFVACVCDMPRLLQCCGALAATHVYLLVHGV